METEIVSAVQTVDFSLFALFWRATVVVKIVMIILIVASFWSWSIIFQKFINFLKVDTKEKSARDDFLLLIVHFLRGTQGGNPPEVENVLGFYHLL